MTRPELTSACERERARPEAPKSASVLSEGNEEPREDTAEEPLLHNEDSGIVYVEFLLAFPPLITFVLCIAQYALLHVGDLVVKHAANAAARSAIVVLPDDPARYGDEELNTVGAGGGGDPMQAFLARSRLGGGTGASESGRLGVIRAAAAMRLLAIAPAGEEVGAEKRSVFGAIGGEAQSSWGQAADYVDKALALTFPRTPGGDAFATEFDPYGEVTARVTFLFPCAVPIALQLMCDAADAIGSTDRKTSDTRRASMESGVAELSEGGAQVGSLNRPGARFAMLRSEATLTNQGAAYAYTAGTNAGVFGGALPGGALPGGALPGGALPGGTGFPDLTGDLNALASGARADVLDTLASDIPSDVLGQAFGALDPEALNDFVADFAGLDAADVLANLPSGPLADTLADLDDANLATVLEGGGAGELLSQLSRDAPGLEETLERVGDADAAELLAGVGDNDAARTLIALAEHDPSQSAAILEEMSPEAADSVREAIEDMCDHDCVPAVEESLGIDGGWRGRR